jgi:membrane associated rhomboid family serine protease
MYTRPDRLPPIVKNLIIINVLVFVAVLVLKQQFDLGTKFSLFPIGLGFEPYQIATHMFTHAEPFHLLFNMFGLWMFGFMLENIWGPKRFFLFYILCGIGAAVVHLTVQHFTHDYSSAMGASGAVMGILVAFAYLFPNTQMFIMFIPVPVKAKWLVLGMVVMDLIGGLGRFADDNVARFAHLGGAATGFILVLIWNKTNRRRFY